MMSLRFDELNMGPESSRICIKEVMRYMSKFDLIKNCAQIRSENHKPNRL
ncbi:unnamed protein product, partial [Schistosoma curassoni]|uniref:Uncharacterized protein n=1 Tax=Schistosoma curassoni TaxID=6186 RepID=A0A183KIK6_9TREM